ncbi:HpcH/HpaI aldolase/citrate lyase family protein [Limimaricola litoreus]|uniref:CoA ester lyase n=1 Tax=Limimaricola litoreus TaxID=2955316 RepID=A0A9X2FTM2_9RHOB|nr:CoA ester lyase [Limimaricola litoreus]MCP1166953.1 CoA ester lyase [Limimaricola litoreus]
MPLRSMLYVPASNARALAKARDLPCDALILDLEDAVAPAAKEEARAALGAALAAKGRPAQLRLVRINGLDTPWGAEDLAALAGCACDGIVVPKVDGPADLDAVAARTERPLWAMIETARGVLRASDTCAHPRLSGIVMGTNDLGREIGLRPTADRFAILPALQGALLAARAHGIAAIDGVCNALGDAARLEAECAQGRDLGFDGKSLIHPAQIAAANATFAPSAEEIDLARRRIAAFEAVLAEGQGVAVVDGEIVEALHVEAARTVLDLARMVEGGEGA